MGFLVLLVLLALWIWWPKQKGLPTTASPKIHEFESKVALASTPASFIVPASTPSTPGAPEESQPVERISDIPQCTLTVREGECAVCCSTRPARFVSRRVRLCQWCVKGLNESAPIDVVALARVVETFRREVEDQDTFWQAVLNGQRNNRSIGRKVQQLGIQPEGASSTFWLKGLRAFHLGLISSGVACIRPAEGAWNELARKIRHADSHKCQICDARGEELHVHHIIHLANFGTNEPINLVTLCYQHHRDQHPHIQFSLDTQEGTYQEDSL